MLPMQRTFADQNFQNDLDAELIYTTIEEEIAPMYYKRDEQNIPYEWIRAVKNCIADIASNFTTNRMLRDYEERFYNKLYERHRQMVTNDFIMAREIAAWKRKVSNSWDKVNILAVKQLDMGKEAIKLGNPYHVEVTVDVDGLRPQDIGVELIIASQIDEGKVKIIGTQQLNLIGHEGSQATYAVDSVPDRSGTFDMALRVYPKNDRLPHRMDFALVKWA